MYVECRFMSRVQQRPESMETHLNREAFKMHVVDQRIMTALHADGTKTHFSGLCKAASRQVKSVRTVFSQ